MNLDDPELRDAIRTAARRTARERATEEAAPAEHERTVQLDTEDLKSMTPDQIVEAKRAGRCDRLLGRAPAYTYPANLF